MGIAEGESEDLLGVYFIEGSGDALGLEVSSCSRIGVNELVVT